MKRAFAAFRVDRDQVSVRLGLGPLSLALGSAVAVILGPVTIVHAQPSDPLAAISVE
jgi:hypothetical protein